MSVYLIVKIILRASLRFYFKNIQIEGLDNVPRDTPILFTANHQNALLDALLLGAFSPVPLYFLTRSDVFKWWSKPLMALVHMMPIYRIRDGYAKLSRNEAVFHACEELFEKDQSILIFAEGNHGEHHYLRPLTKGAARLALQAQLKKENLKIVPAGLNYFSHQQPGSNVLIVFGEPVSIADHAKNYKPNSGEGLVEFREVITSGMKSTLIIPDKTDNYEVLKKGIFRKENQNLTFSELKKLSVSSNTSATTKSESHLLSGFLNPIPILIIRRILSGVNDIVFHSSLKFITGLIVFPVWWVASFFIFSHLYGIITGAIVVSLMIASLLIDYKWSR